MQTSRKTKLKLPRSELEHSSNQRKTTRRSKPLGRKKMKAWITIEPNKEERDELLIGKSKEGECKTPLKAVIDHAYCLMTLGHEVSLKITTMKWKGREPE